MLYIPLLFIYSTTSRKEIEGLVIKNLKKKKKKKQAQKTSAANQLKSGSEKNQNKTKPY